MGLGARPLGDWSHSPFALKWSAMDGSSRKAVLSPMPAADEMPSQNCSKHQPTAAVGALLQETHRLGGRGRAALRAEFSLVSLTSAQGAQTRTPPPHPTATGTPEILETALQTWSSEAGRCAAEVNATGAGRCPAIVRRREAEMQRVLG